VADGSVESVLVVLTDGENGLCVELIKVLRVQYACNDNSDLY